MISRRGLEIGADLRLGIWEGKMFHKLLAVNYMDRSMICIRFKRGFSDIEWLLLCMVRRGRNSTLIRDLGKKDILIRYDNLTEYFISE